MRTLFGFRSDLRTLDNPALHAACATSDRGVVALFVVPPGKWLAHDLACDTIACTRRESPLDLGAWQQGRTGVPLVGLGISRPRAIEVFRVL
ncbi:MAG: deoxyribodipyrimidine photo-lyase [Phycisphaerales bacterium]